MYETADMMSISKRRIVENIMTEARAGKIPEIPEAHSSSVPATGKRAAAYPAAPAGKPAANPTRKAGAVSEKFGQTARDCSADIKKLQDRISQINKDIIELSKYGMKSQNYDAISNLKAERDRLQKQIEQLQGIRKRCLWQIGK